MKLIVGLGNEGGRYQGTRHNVGMETVSQLARHQGVHILGERALRRETSRSRYGDWNTPQGIVRLMCPVTMMNASGDAVADSKEWNIQPADVLLVCDDVNLPLGTVRLRPQGSDGGHRGLASCLEALGTQDVPRLRVGVGRAPLPSDLTEFVLSPFEASERQTIREAIRQAVEACEVWVTDGMQAAMNRVNPAPRPPQPPQ